MRGARSAVLTVALAVQAMASPPAAAPVVAATTECHPVIITDRDLLLVLISINDKPRP